MMINFVKQLCTFSFLQFPILLVGLFSLSPAFASEDWLELDDPRPFVGECSFETAKEVSFEEVALSHKKYSGKCVQITGYYSAALYDGPEGFFLANGDEWFGVSPDVLQRNRIGLYFPVDHEEYFLEDPKTEQQRDEQDEYWDKEYGVEHFERRNVTLAATAYSCERWLKDAGKRKKDRDFLFWDYCYYANGAIVVVHDWKLVEGQGHDPVLDLGPDKIDDDWHVIGASIDNADPACNWDGAEPVDFEDVALKPYLYFRKCVRVKGLWNGWNNLYNGHTGLYLSQKEDRQNRRSNRIGLYPNNNMADGFYSQDSQRTNSEILGRVRTCDHIGRAATQRSNRASEGYRLAADNEDGIERIAIPFFGGYCHYYLGTVIDVDGLRKFDEEPSRLIGKKNREKYGNFFFAEEDWEHREAFLENAEEVLTEELSEEVQKPGDLEKSPLPRYLAHRDKVGKDNIDVVLFLEDKDPYRPSFVEGSVCYCLEESCDGKWPISIVDAWYKPKRPYMCVYLDNGVYSEYEEMKINARDQW